MEVIVAMFRASSNKTLIIYNAFNDDDDDDHSGEREYIILILDLPTQLFHFSRSYYVPLFGVVTNQDFGFKTTHQ